MRCVLKRTDQGGGYVAPAGSHNSYTKYITKARVYPSKEEAEADRCVENEIIISLDEIWNKQ